MMKYSDLYLKLSHEVATIVFFKKDGNPRTMLATRNTITSEINGDKLGGMLAGYDKRNSIKNGVLPVIDLSIGEVRSFSTERLTSVQWHGVIEDKDKLEEIVRQFREFETLYNETKPKVISLDELTELNY